MIQHIRGRLCSKQPGEVVVECGGVGYGLSITATTYGELPALGEEAFLHVHQVVREDSLSLCGFATQEERALFLNLLRVTGVGPVLALGIVGQAPLQQIVQAVVSGDHAFLQRLKGVGKKLSERIVVELRDRLHGWAAGESTATKTAGGYPDDAYKALLVLGLNPEEARRRLAEIAATPPKPERAEDWIRRALRHA